MTISEKDFQDKVIVALRSYKITVTDTSIGGRFDLLLDEQTQRYIEPKIARRGYKAHKPKLKGISFTKLQEKELRKLSELPIVFTCDCDNPDMTFIIYPNELAEFVKS